jgi:hypothetical protein
MITFKIPGTPGAGKSAELSMSDSDAVLFRIECKDAAGDPISLAEKPMVFLCRRGGEVLHQWEAENIEIESSAGDANDTAVVVILSSEVRSLAPYFSWEFGFKHAPGLINRLAHGDVKLEHSLLADLLLG